MNFLQQFLSQNANQDQLNSNVSPPLHQQLQGQLEDPGLLANWAPVRGLFNLFGTNQQFQSHPDTQLPGAQQLFQRNDPYLNSNALPDITYNPNFTTNIPYSTHSPETARLGNEYTQNPTDPRFLGIDPAQFGYPADHTTPSPLLQRYLSL